MFDDRQASGSGSRSDAPPAVIVTTGLTKRYGPVLAVSNLDLEVRLGEVYGFLGPNGAGKTTTLRMLAGLVRPTSGSALIAGHSPGSSGSLRKVGCLIESPAYYPYLSGRDNLRVIAGYAGADARLVETVLQTVDLIDRAADRVATYSLGMKQRLAIAATLVKQPEVLLLDEPTNGLDPQGVAEVRALVKSLQTSNRAVLVSSHLLHEVELICTRVGVINRGKLIMQGTVDDLRGDATTITVRASPHDAALKVLVDMFGAAVVEKDGTFSVTAGNFDAAEIIRRLVVAGVAVTDVHQTQRSLEEAFLALTGTRDEQPC